MQIRGLSQLIPFYHTRLRRKTPCETVTPSASLRVLRAYSVLSQSLRSIPTPRSAVQRLNATNSDPGTSPSNTSAIAQAIQIPGITGMENNLVIFEYDKENPVDLPEIVDNFSLVNSGDFDIAILAGSQRDIQYKNGIHLWINSFDTENANLMILLSFIISGHPDWKKGVIRIFNICREEDLEKTHAAMKELILAGRLPITAKNVKLIVQNPDVSTRTIISKNSVDAGLTMIGLREELLKREKGKLFDGYDRLGTVLFVHSKNQKDIV